MNELKSQKVAFDNDDIKEDRNESVSSKTFVVAKSGKPEKGLDKVCAFISTGLIIARIIWKLRICIYL